MSDGGLDHPDVETIGAGDGPREDPLIPCHECGTEERFMTMKHDPDWTLKYVDAPCWVAFCPDCCHTQLNDNAQMTVRDRRRRVDGGER